ncbi:MAG: hypothetical protein J3Q66DRAFT_375911 [Benniella sp.]|nr:MAG: hypothetical protein J3Q66DRAFT_375911 [Benniella sp.]
MGLFSVRALPTAHSLPCLICLSDVCGTTDGESLHGNQPAMTAHPPKRTFAFVTFPVRGNNWLRLRNSNHLDEVLIPQFMHRLSDSGCCPANARRSSIGRLTQQLST